MSSAAALTLWNYPYTYHSAPSVAWTVVLKMDTVDDAMAHIEGDSPSIVELT